MYFTARRIGCILSYLAADKGVIRQIFSADLLQIWILVYKVGNTVFYILHRVLHESCYFSTSPLHLRHGLAPCSFSFSVFYTWHLLICVESS
jgi:hypothetical protein